MPPGRFPATVSRRYHGLLVAALPAPLGASSCSIISRNLSRLPDGRRVRFGGDENRAASGCTACPPLSRSFASRTAAASGAIESDGRGHRKAAPARPRPEYGACHLSPALRAGSRAARPASFGPFPPARKRCRASRCAGDYSLLIQERRYEIAPTTMRRYPPLRLLRFTTTHGAFTHEGGRPREISLPDGSGARLSIARPAVEPGLSSTSNLRPTRPSRSSPRRRPWPAILALDSRAGARRPNASAGARLLPRADPQARDGPGRGTGPGRGPIHHHARRPRGGCRARPRRRR